MHTVGNYKHAARKKCPMQWSAPAMHIVIKFWLATAPATVMQNLKSVKRTTRKNCPMHYTAHSMHTVRKFWWTTAIAPVMQTLRNVKHAARKQWFHALHSSSLHTDWKFLTKPAHFMHTIGYVRNADACNPQILIFPICIQYVEVYNAMLNKCTAEKQWFHTIQK